MSQFSKSPGSISLKLGQVVVVYVKFCMRHFFCNWMSSSWVIVNLKKFILSLYTYFEKQNVKFFNISIHEKSILLLPLRDFLFSIIFDRTPTFYCDDKLIYLPPSKDLNYKWRMILFLESEENVIRRKIYVPLRVPCEERYFVDNN